VAHYHNLLYALLGRMKTASPDLRMRAFPYHLAEFIHWITITQRSAFQLLESSTYRMLGAKLFAHRTDGSQYAGRSTA